VMQQDQSSFSGLGLRGRLPTRLSSRVEILPFVEYWRSQSTIESYGVTTRRTDATLGAFARCNFGGSTMHPYLGMGYGLHFLSDEVQAARLGLPEGSNSLIKGGIAFLGGASFPLTGSVGTLLEGEYHYLPGVSQFKLNWGLGFSF